MNRCKLLGVMTLLVLLSGPAVVPIHAQDSAPSEKQLKHDEQANKDQAKADKQQRKAMKAQQKAEKAAKKSKSEAEKAGSSPSQS